MYNVDIGCFPMQKFITTKEAAKVLGVHPITVRRWNKAGKLKAARHPMNNYRLYKWAEIQKLSKKIGRSNP